LQPQNDPDVRSRVIGKITGSKWVSAFARRYDQWFASQAGGSVVSLFNWQAEASARDVIQRLATVLGDSEHERQSQLLRCVMGNPFRPAVVIESRWQTSTVIDLATAIYEECAFDRMPILADALMDAACDNDEITGHCRSEGPHVKGCWVIDLLLGKE
jgi:hypothetical protein